MSVHDHIFGTRRLIFITFLPLSTYGRGSILLWWRSDTLRIFRFINDVKFAHKPWLLDFAAQLKRSVHTATDLAIECVQ